MQMQCSVKFDPDGEPCVFCGGEMYLADSRGTANVDGSSSSYWREECKRCFSSKIGTDGRIYFERSGHPLSLLRDSGSRPKGENAEGG
jgi:hypothetical protein